MTTIDLQYRHMAISFEDKGASVFPKKKTRYAKQQAVIAESINDLDNKKIGVEEFLKKCSEAMIHQKYFKLVEAATERLKKSTPDDTEADEFNENMMAIFTTDETSSGRIKKIKF